MTKLRVATAAAAMPDLQVALDAESYEWMAANNPDILRAIEREVRAGHEPRSIRQFVLVQTSRWEIALRCEQAARHILAVMN